MTDAMKRLEEAATRSGMTVEALVTEMAQDIVSRWESIPKVVAQFCRQHPEMTDEGAQAWETSLRELVGGEEVYLASKKFLGEQNG
jgi:hypothetical protein